VADGRTDRSPPDEELADELGGYRLLSELEETFPGVQLSQPFPWPDAWWRPTRGQTHSLGYARIELGFQALVDRHEAGEHVAIVCHGNLIDRMITMIMDFPRRGQRKRFYTDYTGISRLDRIEEDRWEIQYTNRTDHL
jgi:broad specificity phosphatase PhoE